MTPLWQDVFVNQWAFAAGTQLTRSRMKYRLGYSYNSNPINHSVGGNLDGFPIAQQANIELFLAALVPRSTSTLHGGIGWQGFLIPTLDLDLFAGGLLVQGHFGSNARLGGGLLHRLGNDLAVRRLHAVRPVTPAGCCSTEL